MTWQATKRSTLNWTAARIAMTVASKKRRPASQILMMESTSIFGTALSHSKFSPRRLCLFSCWIGKKPMSMLGTILFHSELCIEIHLLVLFLDTSLPRQDTYFYARTLIRNS